MNDAMKKAAAAAADVDQHILETRIRPLVTPETIAEHQADPFGAGHGPELEMLLRFLRRNPMRTKPRYLLVETVPYKEWCLALYHRRRGEGPTLTDTRFTSREAAQHAIFLKRLLDLDDPTITSVVEAAEH
ncbi:hypothetical protein [Micromonospora sp. NPDC049679]|uniref:hypothetical protein n=1 Tax=Micromonospora sp. NPDC049679 TaxID=3155920 RepID=UPI0033F1F63D